MNTGISYKYPSTYFLLVFILSIPFWVIGTLWDRYLLSKNLPISALMFVCPAVAASILVYRESGIDGVKQLLKRSLDYKRIENRIWYLPIIFLLPVVMILEYGLLKASGVSIPGFQFSVKMLPVIFVAFFISASFEEIGWSGYSFDPLQDRWNALWAGIVLGLVWGIWHSIPYFQAHNTPIWVAWQCAGTIGTRILIVWLYNNTGKSVFAATLFHAMYNICFLFLFPVYGSYYSPFITFVIVAIIAAIITYLWGPKTLAKYRFV